MSDGSAIDCSSYAVTDRFFGPPYVDRDEWRELPYPHRHVHGGFVGCDTRFTFSFPAKEEWQGRMYMPLEGAHAGHEDVFCGPMGDLIGGLALTARLGGYMAESNMGHIGDDIDPKGGDDPTLYGWRAAAETGRFSKYVAAQVYGSRPTTAMSGAAAGAGDAHRSSSRTRRTSSTGRSPSWAEATSPPSRPLGGSRGLK